MRAKGYIVLHSLRMGDIGWNVAGLVVNIPGVIDVCISFGNFINNKISIYRNARNHANEIANRFDIMWRNIVDIIRAIRDIEDKLTPDMKVEINQTLNRLRDILAESINTASSAGVFVNCNPTTRQAIMLSAHQKKKLEDMVNYGQTWHDEILKRLLVINFTQPGLLGAVTRHLQPNPIPPLRRTSSPRPLPSPPAEVVLHLRPPTDLFRLKDSNVFRSISLPYILVELRSYDHLTMGGLPEYEANVYGMVRMLKSADSRLMSILQCEGVYPFLSGENPRFELQYRLPSDLGHPRSLRDLLTDKSVQKLHPLNHRFRLANHLASSILYVHSGEFVHKTIKPENILMMTKADALPKEQFPHVLGWPFLVGFDRSRPASAHSGKYGEVKLEDGLYQHPSRWGVHAEEAFTMQHDIYSLGVVLLEIGLWQPLVWYNEVLGRFEFADLFNDIFQARDVTIMRNEQKAMKVKQRLLDLAEQYLPPTVGETYANVVAACLKIHEGGMHTNDDFAIPTNRANEGLGTSYIKYVIKKLESLNVV